MSGLDPPLNHLTSNGLEGVEILFDTPETEKRVEPQGLQGTIHPQSRKLHQASKLEIMKCAASETSQPTGKRLGWLLV